MIRIVLFLLLTALTAYGAAWVAEQAGDVTLTWGGWRAQATLPVFALALCIVILAALVAWNILSGLLRVPGKIRRGRRELNTLTPADRAAAQGWLDKTTARDAALAASRQFAADAMTALAKPAQ